MRLRNVPVSWSSWWRKYMLVGFLPAATCWVPNRVGDLLPLRCFCSFLVMLFGLVKVSVLLSVPLRNSATEWFASVPVPSPEKGGEVSTRKGKWPKRIASVYAIFPKVGMSQLVLTSFCDWFPVLTDKFVVVGSSSSKFFSSPQFQTMTALFFLQRNQLHSWKTLWDFLRLSWDLGIESCQNRTP